MIHRHRQHHDHHKPGVCMNRFRQGRVAEHAIKGLIAAVEQNLRAALKSPDGLKEFKDKVRVSYVS